MPLRRLAASLLLSFALAGSALAQGLPPAQKALLLLRVLAYDRNLKARARQEVRIAVVFRPGHAASERERDALLRAIEEVTGRAVVSGLPVQALAVPYQDATDLRARLAVSGAAAMYLCTGLDEAGSELAKAAAKHAALSICGSREQATRGCAVALVDRGERAALIVNPRAAVLQGANLDAALLSVAERVESTE